MRFAVVKDGELQAALYISRGNGLPSRDWLISQLGGDGGASSMELLAGRSAQPAQDRGPILCVCFDVGTRTILQAIADQQLTSVEAVGAALSARSEEHTSELQSLMRISYAVLCL